MPIVMTPTTAAIWLIPFVQLKASARAQWLGDPTHGLLPQIMTVRDWASSMGAVQKGRDDLQFDAGIDRITAAALLRRAGQEAMPVFIQRLLDAAYELAAVAAAMPPDARLAWASEQAATCHSAAQFQVEGVLNQIALVWSATSVYATDILWQRRTQWQAAVPHFYVSDGLQTDALTTALLADCASRLTVLPLLPPLPAPEPQALPHLIERVASDLDDLVQQTVNCIVANQDVQTMPRSMALVAMDRQITRRICAVLHNRGIAVLDETGWALSTTAVAAQFMAWLDALARQPTSDAVLAAMKAAPSAFAADDVAALEQRIRRESWVNWRDVERHIQREAQREIHQNAASKAVILFQTLRTNFAAARTMVQWLGASADLLRALGLWDAFQDDSAGQSLIAALHLDAGSVNATNMDATHSLFASTVRTSFPDFVQWVRAVLEANRFRPKPHVPSLEGGVQVTVLPLAQLWGRTFDAVIAPGCDERRLSARPSMTGDWSTAQREALGLITPDQAAAAQAKAWLWLCASRATLLWSQSDGGEARQPSLLLESLALQGQLQRMDRAASVFLESEQEGDQGLEHAGERAGERAGEPEAAPAASPPLDIFQQGVVIDWQTLAPAKLSASAYADLRACPYRFYATRILGLQAAEELDDAVDKRDFGTWLHGVLYRFHEAEKSTRDAVVSNAVVSHTAVNDSSMNDRSLQDEQRREQLNACALAEQTALGLDAAAFLPFELIWPQTREAYLAWLATHEATGAQYLTGEVWKRFPLEVAGKAIELIGKLDRIDTSKDGLWLLDYKTEAMDKTKKRITSGDEDTQLAFYAALMMGHTGAADASAAATELAVQAQAELPIQAAYINLVERPVSKPEQLRQALPDVMQRREALLDGIWDDLSRIADGHGLRALGEGEACSYCTVRGLCRKDFQ
jgi:ATP-dependent helicase/nuclease subunit B